MESTKHNDDLIKRKLDSISIEPSKLNFTTLEANYQKAKRSSSKKWLLIWLFTALSFGSLFTGYFMLNHNSRSNQTTSQLAINKQNDKAELSGTNSSESQQNKSLTAPEEDNATSSNKTTNEATSTPELRSASTSHEDFKSKPNTPISSENSIQSTSEEKNSKENIKSTTGNASSESKSELNKTLNPKKDASTLSEETKAKKETKTATTKTSSSKETKSEINKSVKPSYTAPLTSLTNKTESAKNTVPTTKETGTSEKQTKSSETIPKEKTAIENSVAKENTKVSEPKTESKSTDNINALIDPKKDEKLIERKNAIIDSLQTIIHAVATDSLDKGKDKKSVNNPKTNDLLSSNITPTTSTEKITNHHFSLSTEVIFSNINYASKPNAKAQSIYGQKSPTFPQLYSDGQTGNNYRLFSGAAILGYTYKNSMGFNAGLGFFNVETKIDGKAFAQTKTQLVFDHYTYDSTMQIMDTIYKVGSTRHVNVVNGDTVEAQDYLNNVRFVTIPLNFTYKLNLTNKFSVEPQLGIQYAIPIKSYQLIATHANTFEYSKNKLYLNPRTIFFDLALKLNYKIGTNTYLYIKQGYFFNNKSIYNVDYVLDYRLKNVYTSFGITINLK